MERNAKPRQRIPFWNVDVQPYKDKSIFWHAIWESAGRPVNNELHKIMKKTRNAYHYAIRKSKRMVETLKKNAFLDACINDNDDIFKLIRKERKTSSVTPTVIDGVVVNIENHFAGIYSKLYNSVNDEEELLTFKCQLSSSISPSSIDDVMKVTPEVVYDAIHHLKNSKTDPILDFKSDCIKNTPWSFCEHLAFLFRQFLIHGHISTILLVSTLIPLVKDKLGDLSSSDNYRSVAISSLVLKIFDWVILLLHADKLVNDELQFGFQEHTSTGMCTWLVVETIEYFQRNGSSVYACVMDMKKAFDLVKHSTLFQKLADKQLPAIFIRLLVVMYEKQQANVRWNNSLSGLFPIKNGVKQGAVLSPRLYCVYTDDLFDLLRRKRTGCWVANKFIGIIGYADDLILLSPTIDGLQEMVKTCEEFAIDNNLVFSTHQVPQKCKTKCVAFTKKQECLNKILLNDKELPWVNNVKHLGCNVTTNIHGLPKDIMEKRGQYINRANELDQEFHFADTSTRVKINKMFNTSYYGSQLWDLFSKEEERIEKSWNVSQRILLRIPRNSHRFFY